MSNVFAFRACRKFNFTEKEENDIKFCNESSRPVLVSFMGILRSQARSDLATLMNGKDVLVTKHGLLYDMMNTTDPGIAFERLAKRSAFSAAPRGKIY